MASPCLWEKREERDGVRSWIMMVWCLVCVIERAWVGFRGWDVSTGAVTGLASCLAPCWGCGVVIVM